MPGFFHLVQVIVTVASHMHMTCSYHLTRNDAKISQSLSPGSIIITPQLQIGSAFDEGIPHILKTLQAYFEPQQYRMRQISASKIVGGLHETSKTPRVTEVPHAMLNNTYGNDIKMSKKIEIIHNEAKDITNNTLNQDNIQLNSNRPENVTLLARNGTEIFHNEINETISIDNNISIARNSTINGTQELSSEPLSTKFKPTKENFKVSSPVSALNKTKAMAQIHARASVKEDPLVIKPRPDSRRRTVDFPFGRNGTYWCGKTLLFSKPGHIDLKEEQYAYLQQTVWSGGWNISQLAQYSLEDVMQPWEWDIYKYPALGNIKETVDELFSKVEFLNSSRTVKIGDRVVIRVDLYDGYGRPRSKGGDDIRVWLKDETVSGGLSVDVTDLGNGSYVATIPLLFPGSPQVKVSVTYPREIIRLVYYLRNVMKGMRLNVGGFVSEFARYKYLIRWRTHALPFHTNTDHWAPNTNQQSVGQSLDEIPATGNYIVVLHMYLHFTTHHYSVYTERIRAMREAVERLLVRNPQAKIVIRGPHAAFKGWTPMLGGDVQAMLYLSILKKEFKHLYDKILLLDFWDMTVAAESEDFHPEAKVTQQMIRILFAHVCH
ncbi:nxpe family member 3 [Plakobranchus ocellatus]|uniref:Nxpe family member 3 n=1 Tax=Plakobranchus ocellatus TaxID=259542 RepID=A0AAV4AH23_9GAST|nr:nxpe family member 3 [Plakobranchus ocellatus]